MKEEIESNRNAGKIAGIGKIDLTPREARVVPLALEFDKLDNQETTVEQWNEHYLRCLEQECPDMAKRALRKKGLAKEMLYERKSIGRQEV